jgi:hypothetical protein
MLPKSINNYKFISKYMFLCTKSSSVCSFVCVPFRRFFSGLHLYWQTRNHYFSFFVTYAYVCYQNQSITFISVQIYSFLHLSPTPHLKLHVTFMWLLCGLIILFTNKNPWFGFFVTYICVCSQNQSIAFISVQMYSFLH